MFFWFVDDMSKKNVFINSAKERQEPESVISLERKVGLKNLLCSHSPQQ